MKAPILNNRLYDTLKYIAQIVLPGSGTLYFALAKVWGLPNAEQVSGTVLAVDVFLGALLNLSSKAYNSSDAKYDGVIEVDHAEDKVRMSSEDVQDAVVRGKKEVTFKVIKKKPTPTKSSRELPKGR